MGTLTERNMRGFKQYDLEQMVELAANAPASVATAEKKGSANPTPTYADMSAALSKQNEIIAKQNAIIAEQNAKLKATTSAMSRLMSLLAKLKAEKPQAEASQRDDSSTMAQLRKRFGL